MSLNWKSPKIFKRFSSIYTFSRNPLLKRNENCHVYIPWNPSIVNDLMFQLKARVVKSGHVFIPFMDLNQGAEVIPEKVFQELSEQLSKVGETHLIMSDFDSIHIFRIVGLLKHQGPVISEKEHFLDCLAKNEFKYWFKVDDVYVADANHLGNSKTLVNSLEGLVREEQTQKIFITPYRQELKDAGVDQKWVEQGRSLTYDYFIRLCELKDNIYQDSWPVLARNTQHHLISCELKKNRSVFERGHGKAKLLVESFQFYRDALVAELSEIYILPLINAIENYPCLEEAWGEIQKNGLINREVTRFVQDILDGKTTKIESLSTFLFYIKNAKSFIFSLKVMFEKKIHKEEFLLVENFLFKQESLIDSFSCRSLDSKIQSIIELDAWITHNTQSMDGACLDDLKDLNLKLSHLLSIMGSASYQDNIFFRLIEEKALRGTVQKSFEEEVRSLLSNSLKKESA